MCACVCVCVSSSARELVRERERGGERESVREGASAERESPPSRLLPSLLLAERGFLEVRRVGVREHERLGDARLVGCGICAAAGLQHVVHLGIQREAERQDVPHIAAGKRRCARSRMADSFDRRGRRPCHAERSLRRLADAPTLNRVCVCHCQQQRAELVGEREQGGERESAGGGERREREPTCPPSCLPSVVSLKYGELAYASTSASVMPDLWAAACALLPAFNTSCIE